MKTLMLIAVLTTLSQSAHAQTANDVRTQVEVTQQSIQQAIRTLKSGVIDPTLNLKDYRAWRKDFDERVEATLLKFERKMVEEILPKVQEAGRDYEKVMATTQLRPEEKDQSAREEWSRLEARTDLRQAYLAAIGEVYDSLFPGLPVAIRRISRNNWDQIEYRTYSNAILRISGKVLYKDKNKELGINTSDPGLYGYHLLVYPQIRQHCQSRLCVSLTTQKLKETLELLMRSIDIDLPIQIANQGYLLNRSPLKGEDGVPLYKDVLTTRSYPLEVAQLPFDTK